MSFLGKKLRSVRRRYREKGLASVIALYPRRFYRWAQSHDYLWGRLVELRGNEISVEGLTFSVNSIAISRKRKASFVFDRYEKPERLAIKQFLDPSLPVVEFGGSIGVVACLINRRLNQPAKHVVVEANPDLLANRTKAATMIDLAKGLFISAPGAAVKVARLEAERAYLRYSFLRQARVRPGSGSLY
jgi:hypothetical protein